VLDDRPDEFDHRNLFFQAVLGAISAFGRLDAALAREFEAGAPVPIDHPWLLCVLGAVALREQAMTALEGTDANLSARPVAPALPPFREILR
jgi:hypothetical protein